MDMTIPVSIRFLIMKLVLNSQQDVQDHTMDFLSDPQAQVCHIKQG